MSTSITPLTVISVCIAAIVAAVSIKQWLIARDKLRLDLFDRRYKVFDAAKKFLSQAMRDGNLESLIPLHQFYSDTDHAEFLFGREVPAYLDELVKHILDLHTLHEEMTPLPVGPERTRLAKKIHDQLIWVSKQHEQMRRVFRPYLYFPHRHEEFQDFIEKPAKVV